MTVSEIINIINKYKKTKIKFVDNPIMNQMSYNVSTNLVKKYKFNFLSNIEKNIKITHLI